MEKPNKTRISHFKIVSSYVIRFLMYQMQIPIASIEIKYCYYPKSPYVGNFRYSHATENCIFLFNEIIVLKEGFLVI